ncbi:hypothetical protein EMIT0232MI5_20246 [Pseudomonas sp. IT-232MI5]
MLQTTTQPLNNIPWQVYIFIAPNSKANNSSVIKRTQHAQEHDDRPVVGRTACAARQRQRRCPRAGFFATMADHQGLYRRRP